MECKVKSCGEWENYAFIEFCPADSLRVWPLIERLALEGVRVWFPNGESAKDISERLRRCTACVFLASEEAIGQHSFLSKLIYAVGHAKSAVFVCLEAFTMPVGLMLQADALGSYPADALLCEKLSEDSRLKSCRSRDLRPTDAQLSEWRQRAEAFRKAYEESRAPKPASEPGVDILADLVRDDETDRAAAAEAERKAEEEKRLAAAAAEAERKIEEEKRLAAAAAEAERKIEEEKRLAAAAAEAERKAGEDDDTDVTVYGKTPDDAVLLVRLATGQTYEVKKPVTSLGREPRKGEKADVTFDNTQAISRFHACLIRIEGKVFLRHDKGQFGTFFDGRALAPGETAALENRSVFRLTDEDFCLLLSPDAEACRGLEPQKVLALLREEPEDRTVYQPPQHKKAAEEAKPEAAEVKDAPADEAAPERTVRQSKNPPEAPEEPAGEPSGIDDLISEMTVRIPRKPAAPADDPEKTVRQQVLPAVIVRLRTGELFPLRQIETVIGRKAERRKADIMLDGNPELSREHAVIYQYKNKFMLRDCGSLLGTSIDGVQLDQEHAHELPDGAVFRLADEDILFLTGKSAREAQNCRKLGILRSAESGEEKVLLSGVLPLDRLHPWKDGLLAKPSISRKHAELLAEDGGFLVRDLGSSNGTTLNGVDLAPPGKGFPLRSGDRLWVHDLEYRFSELELR